MHSALPGKRSLGLTDGVRPVLLSAMKCVNQSMEAGSIGGSSGVDMRREDCRSRCGEEE